jgi:hypothetical protein
LPDPDDGVDFLPDTIRTQVIRDDALHSGVRVTMVAQLATAQVKLRLDINFGDPVTPGLAPLSCRHSDRTWSRSVCWATQWRQCSPRS